MIHVRRLELLLHTLHPSIIPGRIQQRYLQFNAGPLIQGIYVAIVVSRRYSVGPGICLQSFILFHDFHFDLNVFVIDCVRRGGRLVRREEGRPVGGRQWKL